MADGDPGVDVPGAARLTADVTRGVRRALASHGLVSVTEFALKSGRRADVMAMDDRGHLTIVEVKVSLADLRADRKWTQYLDFCDLFYFAVPESFPLEAVPEECGLMVADAYDSTVLREAFPSPLNAARRKALLIRFGRAAASRVHRLEDPGI
ncbi:MAG: MmcB family DNA repair protein [Inquilinaceae bacterium]